MYSHVLQSITDGVIVYRAGLSGRRVHSASSKPSRQACSPGWCAPQPQAYGLPQQRRNQLSPGPGSYNAEASGISKHASCRGVDFTRGSQRPGSAPPLLPSQDLHIIPCDTESELSMHLDYCSSPASGKRERAVTKVQQGCAGLQAAHVHSSGSASHGDIGRDSHGKRLCHLSHQCALTSVQF